MRTLLHLAAALMLALGLTNRASALVEIGELTGDDVGAETGWPWPDGLKDIVSRSPRVAAHRISYYSFYDGLEDVGLYYAGDAGALNKFLAEFARLKDAKLTLYLVPGGGVYGEDNTLYPRKKQPVPYDWSVTIHRSGTMKQLSEQEIRSRTQVLIHVRMADGFDLKQLKVPVNIDVEDASAVGSFIDQHKRAQEKAKTQPGGAKAQ